MHKYDMIEKRRPFGRRQIEACRHRRCLEREDPILKRNLKRRGSWRTLRGEKWVSNSSIWRHVASTVRLVAFQNQVLQLGEYLLDPFQIRAVGRQEQQMRAGSPDCLAHRLAFVAGEVVEDDDVACGQGRNENLLDVDLEALAVDRAIEHPRGHDPIVPESGQESHGLPVPERHLAAEPLPLWRPPPQRLRVRLGPVDLLRSSTIDEDQALRINPTLILLPTASLGCDVGPVLLAGHHVFLKLSCSRCTNFQTVR